VLTILVHYFSKSEKSYRWTEKKQTRYFSFFYLAYK